MKRLIGAIMIGAMVLACGQAAYAGGHRGHGQGHSRGHHGGRHGGWGSWDTFGAVCVGLLGAGLIAAAFSDWNQPARPCYTYTAYPPPPPPPPVYPRPVYVVPDCR